MSKITLDVYPLMDDELYDLAVYEYDSSAENIYLDMDEWDNFIQGLDPDELSESAQYSINEVENYRQTPGNNIDGVIIY